MVEQCLRLRSALRRVVLTCCVLLSGASLAEPAVTTESANAPLAQTPSADYRIGPGDLLKVSVFGYADLGIEARVSQSGEISYPFIGQLLVRGLSTADVGSLVSRRLREGAIVKSPQVTVLVLEYQSAKIAVLGQVKKPGRYPIDSESTIIDLLAQAEGLDDANAADEANLLRKDGSKIVVDLDAMFAGDMRQNHVVSGGDTIFVPRAPKFYIYGEVKSPGVYRLERAMTVSQAISAGGGLTAKGSEGRVVVKRRGADGKEATLNVKGDDQLQTNDTLMIKESLL